MFIPQLTSVLFAVAAVVAAPAQNRPAFLPPTQMPAPVNFAGTNSFGLALGADGLTALVETDRPGGPGGRDLVRQTSFQTSISWLDTWPVSPLKTVKNSSSQRYKEVRIDARAAAPLGVCATG